MLRLLLARSLCCICWVASSRCHGLRMHSCTCSAVLHSLHPPSCLHCASSQANARLAISQHDLQPSASTHQDMSHLPFLAIHTSTDSIPSPHPIPSGLEVIEAHYLFGVDYDNIDVVIHPQSIIHSMVETHDSSVLAQLGWPDMRLPIMYTMSWPERVPVQDATWPRLDFTKANNLTFKAPDRWGLCGEGVTLCGMFAAGRADGTSHCPWGVARMCCGIAAHTVLPYALKHAMLAALPAHAAPCLSVDPDS